MAGLQGGDAGSVRVDVELAFGGVVLRFEAPVPAGPVPQRAMLPLLRGLADAIIAETERDLEAKGRPISCRAGCAACCRQLVPISEAEARARGELVVSLPEARRSTIQVRFAEARRSLDEAGLLRQLQDLSSWGPMGYGPMAMEYFARGIACPFQEDVCCSIRDDRQIVCREFLVTSPASCCSQPTAETVAAVPLPLRVSAAVARYDAASTPPSFHDAGLSHGFSRRLRGAT